MSGLVVVAKDEYHADALAPQPSLSAGLASTLCTRSPRHAWANHPRLNPDYQPTDDQKFDVGTAAHALLLEGVDAVEVVQADSWRTNDAKAQRDQARENGRIPLLAHDWDSVRDMVEAAQKQLGNLDVEPPPLTDGKPEQTLVWEEPNGVTCRARLDWLRDDLTAIDDLKTTSASANPAGWGKTMLGMGADIQAAFYLRGLRQVFGVVAAFRFIVIENYPPFALSVCTPTPAMAALADAKVDYAINTWRRCLETDTWPAYPTQLCHLESPSWAEEQWFQRLDREEEGL